VFAIAKRRAGRAIARRALMAPLEIIRGTARDEPSVEEAYASRNRLAVVRSALGALPRGDREALLLRLAGELSFDHIAAIMQHGRRTAATASPRRVGR
jgi:DNA-directed RNA polymerase specialized sigma24 family protein